MHMAEEWFRGPSMVKVAGHYKGVATAELGAKEAMAAT